MSILNNLSSLMLAETIGDKLVFGGLVALIGIGVVFAILLFLICVILVFSKVLAISTDKAAKKEAPAVATPVTAPVVVSNDDAVIVAISAAIYAVLLSECSGDVMPEFEIKQVRKIKRY